MPSDANRHKRLRIAIATLLLLLLPRAQLYARPEIASTTTPPFWTAWWFPTLALLAIAVVVLAILRAQSAVMRKRAQELDTLYERLKESEALHRMIVQDQTEFIVRWKPDGTRTFVNDAYCRYFGLTREEALTKNIFSYGNEEHQALLRKVMASLTPESPLSNHEFEVVGPNGEMVWHHWSDRGTHDEQGRLVEVQSIGHDITARKRAEAAVRDLAVELAATEERERRAVATFLHDEIGQSLAVLRMRVEALAEAAESEGTARALVEIREVLDRTIRNTRSLTFDLSPPILYELGLAAAVEWVGRKICSENDLEFEFAEEAEEGEELLDPDTAAQLFRGARELMMNTVKHANASRVEAFVSVDRDAGVCVTLQDNGVGFDSAKELAQARNGSGYGLTSIRERMSYIGGDVRIESAPGGGTRVSLVVPAVPRKPRPGRVAR